MMRHEWKGKCIKDNMKAVAIIALLFLYYKFGEWLIKYIFKDRVPYLYLRQNKQPLFNLKGIKSKYI